MPTRIEEAVVLLRLCGAHHVQDALRQSSECLVQSIVTRRGSAMRYEVVVGEVHLRHARVVWSRIVAIGDHLLREDAAREQIAVVAAVDVLIDARTAESTVDSTAESTVGPDVRPTTGGEDEVREVELDGGAFVLLSGDPEARVARDDPRPEVLLPSLVTAGFGHDEHDFLRLAWWSPDRHESEVDDPNAWVDQADDTFGLSLAEARALYRAMRRHPLLGGGGHRIVGGETRSGASSGAEVPLGGPSADRGRGPTGDGTAAAAERIDLDVLERDIAAEAASIDGRLPPHLTAPMRRWLRVDRALVVRVRDLTTAVGIASEGMPRGARRDEVVEVLRRGLVLP